MQGFHPLNTRYPAFLPQDTDTASPRTPLPIYYIHSVAHPFCSYPLCICHRSLREVVKLLGFNAEGIVSLQEASRLMATEETVLDSPKCCVTFTDALPVCCQLYGHSWEPTDNPDVKECYLCASRGYCPGCTFQAPRGAQPFSCTRHARQKEVQ